ncbi:DUF4331 family protein [Streptomyces mirabilis]|uniref:DUF4331 family protein n=1 Tax=Streptomyces mirabilis TaxID=68239 RepID=UPI003715AFFF
MSDHLSGTRALADPAIDLTDLYVFPSPSRSGRLVLVMNVFPNARPGALFSDAASYRFRVRPASVPMGDSGSLLDVGTDEFALTCTFSIPIGPDDNGELAQRGTCELPNGESISLLVNDERGGEGHGVRCYAGLRLDPMPPVPPVPRLASARPLPCLNTDISASKPSIGRGLFTQADARRTPPHE